MISRFGDAAIWPNVHLSIWDIPFVTAIWNDSDARPISNHNRTVDIY